MEKKLLRIVGATSLVALSSAWPCLGRETNERLRAAPPETESTLGSNRFGFHLYQALLRQDAGKNLFVSPLSVSLALRMTLHGAAGETLEAMRRTLEVGGIDPLALARSDTAMLEALRSADPQVELVIANSIWARSGVEFRPTFLDLVRRHYLARVEAIDFSSPAAPRTINGWVRENTREKIDSIVPEQIPDDVVMYLINAVYFKGTWARQFDKNLTRETPFTLTDGSRVDHPIMSQRGHFNYLQGDGFQAVRLPYGTGRMEMILFLPDEGTTLEAFHANLTAENWERWTGRFEAGREGTVGLPRFEIEYEKSLVDALRGMGMEVAFGGDADFTAMREVRDPFISDVRHKTYVKVDEEGTEAAAVTSVAEGSVMPEEEEPFRLVCDRPFFFAIADRQTGAILFQGTILDPRGTR